MPPFLASQYWPFRKCQEILSGTHQEKGTRAAAEALGFKIEKTGSLRPEGQRPARKRSLLRNPPKSFPQKWWPMKSYKKPSVVEEKNHEDPKEASAVKVEETT